MRDYLYLWNKPADSCLVASGVHFRDLLPELEGTGGLLLLRHGWDRASLEPQTRLDCVELADLSRLSKEDLYSYGDLIWADYGAEVAFEKVPKSSVAELLYFTHAAEPLRKPAIPGLRNRFLCYGHDDGWYMRLYYTRWRFVEPLLRRLLQAMLPEEQVGAIVDDVYTGDRAYWCTQGSAKECEQTERVDDVLSQYWVKPKAAKPKRHRR
jgi:hypothetical protein